MRKVGLDTSVVMRLVTGDPEDLASMALSYVDKATEDGVSLHVCDLVLHEAYFALSHHYGMPKEEALGTLRSLFSTGEIKCTTAAELILQTDDLHSRKPGFVDRLIHATYMSECGSMVTFERAATKLSGSIVIGHV